MAVKKSKIKKIVTTKTQKKRETQKRKLSVSKIINASVAARKVSHKSKAQAIKATSLNASVFDTKGKVVGSLSLPAEIFGAKINDSLMSQAVRVYLANQRQGTVKTKDRGEVDRTSKKVWQQKGTGRARHGSRRAPIFVGGGVVFGPRPRDFSLSLSKKMKTLALFSALSSKLKDRELKIVRGLETITPKTKIMAVILKNLGIQDDNKVLLVMPKVGAESQSVYRASRNIEGVQILSANTLNAYRVLDNKLILMMRDSVDVIKNTFMKGRKS